MEKLKGYVEHIIFKNTENGYGVISLKAGEMEITCTGIFTNLMRVRASRRRELM